MSEDVEQDIPEQNDQLVLVSGASGTGKSGSLMNIRDQDRWYYFNCEAGKRLPFRNKFNQVVITDPWDVHNYLDELIANPEASDGVVIDSITFLMDMFESQYIIGAKDTQKGWSMYAQFFKILLQQKIAAYRKPVIIIAHTLSKLNEQAMEMEVSVPIKGALKNQGVEAYFSTVVSPKKIPIKDLKDYGNDLLTITEEDEILGYKHVFQTRLTKATTGERIRSPMGMFTREQTYINSDSQVLLDHLREFYA